MQKKLLFIITLLYLSEICASEYDGRNQLDDLQDYQQKAQIFLDNPQFPLSSDNKKLHEYLKNILSKQYQQFYTEKNNQYNNSTTHMMKAYVYASESILAVISKPKQLDDFKSKLRSSLEFRKNYGSVAQAIRENSEGRLPSVSNVLVHQDEKKSHSIHDMPTQHNLIQKKHRPLHVRINFF